MKTMLLAAVAVFTLGTGAAFAGDSEGGPVANTAFTELPGVIAQAPGQSASAFAQGQAVPGTNGTVIQQRGAALQYAPSPYQGPSS